MEKLRVVEAFSGVGSQNMGLKELGIPYEIVGTMEIDKYAIISYAAIHHDLEKHLDYSNQNVEEEKAYLEKLGVLDIPRRKKTLHQCYIACKLSNNLGDISKIKKYEIPNHNLFTYSFPCQDISLGGKQKGLSKGSQTRSSLLWECQDVIETKKPNYLLLENVKNLVSKRHKKDFDEWLLWLEEQGYDNYWKVINSKDHGTLQHRNRVFVVSIKKGLRNNPFIFEKGSKNNLKLEDILETEVKEKFFYNNKRLESIKNDLLEEDLKLANNPKLITEPLIDCCPNSREYHGLKTISPTLLARDYKDPKTILLTNGKMRKATPLEYWRLMGFKDSDFYKAEKFVSNTQLYKQAGNSISMPVLKSLFKSMFLAEKRGYDE